MYIIWNKMENQNVEPHEESLKKKKKKVTGKPQA